jgi:hypothetical protein
MDCSGLIGLIAGAAGMTAPNGSDAQKVPSNWILPSDWQLKMKLVTDGSIESGDLVGFPGHIGIAESAGTTASAVVISATGMPGDCQANIKPPRGPRALPIRVFGQTTAVLRLVTTLSGDFDIYIRCATQNTDAAVIRFKINNDQGGPFSATGSGVDYNGAFLSFLLKGTYDQITNVLDATLTLTNGNRVDHLSVKLLNDDSGYQTMNKVVDNGQCIVQARLVRVQAGSPLVVPPNRSRLPQHGGNGPILGNPVQ